MKRKFFYLLFLVVVIIAALLYWRAIISPQYSLKQLEKVIAKNDQLAFDKYVDLDKVIDNAIDQIWQYYTTVDEGIANRRWVEIGNDIGYGLLSLMKPNLNETIKKEVYRYISGKDSEEKDFTRDNNLSAVFARMIKEKLNPEKWEFQSINYSKIENNASFLILTYYDEIRGSNFLVEMKMVNMNGFWQINEITNIAQLFNMFSRI